MLILLLLILTYIYDHPSRVRPFVSFRLPYSSDLRLLTVLFVSVHPDFRTLDSSLTTGCVGTVPRV